MKENVLIVSKGSKAYKIFSKILIVTLLVAFATFLVMGFFDAIVIRAQIKRDLCETAREVDYNGKEIYVCPIKHYHYWSSVNKNELWRHFKKEHRQDISSFYACGRQWFRFAWLFLFFAGYQILLHYVFSKQKITVTDNNVYIKTAFGAKLILPIDKITAYGATKIFSIIHIHAIRGTVYLPFVANNWEIMEVVNKLINERNSNITTG